MTPETKDLFPEDATHTEEVFFVGGRMVGLQELSVQLRAEADALHWKRVVEQLHLEVIKDGDLTHASFFALPERLERFRPFFQGTLALDESAPGIGSWDFHWSRAEDDSPPEDILKSSRAVGGFPAVLDRLARLWPGATSLEAEISASYAVPSSVWRLKLPSARGAQIPTDERALHVTPTRWRIDPPSGCVHEVSMEWGLPTEKVFILRGAGTYTLQWTPRFLNEVDGAIWDGLKTFLESRLSKAKR